VTHRVKEHVVRRPLRWRQQKVRRRTTPSRRQRNRALRAIPLGVGGLRFALAGYFFGKHDRVPNLVGVENVRRQGITAPVTDTTVCVDADASHDAGTGKVSGSDSTDRSAAVKANSVPGLIS
jgi:hypothetical protein